jgi:activator-of-BECN1-regulated-autophagy protein 1
MLKLKFNFIIFHPRIQVWETWSEGIPDIGRSEHNIVVREAKIHNDASVDISSDGRLLVTLVPSNLPMTTLVGLYSLEKDTRGQVLATYRSVV